MSTIWDYALNECEAQLYESGWIEQPFNAFTNTAFLFVALIILFRYKRTKYSVIYSLLLSFIGLSSMYYHAFPSRFTLDVDFWSMILLATFVLAWIASKKNIFTLWIPLATVFSLLFISLPQAMPLE